MSDIVSPVQNTSYTNKDFVRVYEELLDLAKELSSKWDPSLSNESDPGVILLKLNAVIADKCNYNIDKSVLECFPLSVTQLPNARQLFDQLGYRMHWRRSANSTVTINWIGTTTYPEEYITINPFTMITDADNTIVYTLLGPYDNINDYNVDTMKFLCDGAASSAIRCNVIQGVPIDFTISGSKLITIANLDENNRLYFPDTYVAENGVFITNSADSENYNKWQRRDNLSIENFGNFFYRFDVNKEGTNCYIEFPEDVETLFGEGIYIKYIRTDSEYGNINASILSKFYDSITASLGGTNVILNTDVISINNPSAISNGSSFETINDAYRNYKHTVGTFNTLVTLRDYINAIINSGLVSNCFVCDRTNDIQTTYNVLTTVNNVDQPITYIEEAEDNSKLMDAFSLKLYLLNYAASTTDYDSYHSSFNMLTEDSSAVLNVKNYIDSEKCIVHDYNSLLSPGDVFPHVAYFKNMYPIECTITTQTALNTQQKQEIRTNIINALRDNLSSKQVEFGEAIAYDLVYNIISNADPRIKYVSLFNINYSTEAIYYDTTSKLTYIFDDTTHTGAWYDEEFNEVNPVNYGLTAINPVDGAELLLPPSFKSVYINGDYYDDIYFCSNTSALNYVPVNQRDEDRVTTVDVDPTIFYEKVGLENCYKKHHFICASVDEVCDWFVGDQKVNISAFGISYTGTPIKGDKITVSFTKSVSDPTVVSSDVTGGAVNATTFNNYVANMFPSAEGSIIFEYKLEAEEPQWELDGNVVDISEYGISIYADVEEGNQFKVKLSYAHQVKYDVIAKSILVGSTPFYIKDETFDYRLNQIANLPIIEDVAKICGDVAISFTPQNSIYTLRDNESLQLYAPNLVDVASYSNYVKFEYYITENVAANSSYQLRNNEFIIFYWTESDDDAGVLYKYHCYGNGTIINPSFAMTLKTITDKNDTIAVKNNLVLYDIQGNTVESSWSKDALMTLAASEAVAAITSTKNILSGSKNIKVKAVNQLTFTRLSQYYLYWILNDQTPDSFKQSTYTLFTAGETSRMLGAGEYLIYTDAYKKNYEILGEGTLLTRNTLTNDWSVRALDASTVLLNGIAAIEGNWFTLGDNDQLTITENAFTNIGSGCSLNITAKDPKTIFYTLTYESSIDGLVTSVDSGLWYKEYISAGNYILVYSTTEEAWTVFLNSTAGDTITDLSTVGITIDDSIVLTHGCTITINVEYSYKLTFTKDGYTLYIPEDSTTPSTVDLSNFDIKYLLAGQDIESDNWVIVDNVTLNGTIGWNGRSLLSLNFGPDTPQYILSNQTVHLINSKNETLPDIVGGNKTYYIDTSGTFLEHVGNACTIDSDVWNIKNPLAGDYTYTYATDHWEQNSVEVNLESLGITLTGTAVNEDTLIISNVTPSHYPVVIMGSQDVNSYGTDYVRTFVLNYDDSGNIKTDFLKIYSFEELQSVIGSVMYTSTGSVAITLSPEESSKSINFKIPQGTYILPVKNNIDNLTSLKVLLDNEPLTVMYSDENLPGVDYSELKAVKTHYLRMNITNDNLHTLTINMQGHTLQSSVLLDNCFKYVKPTQFGKSKRIMPDSEFTLIEHLMTYLDNLHVFKYNNIVSINEQISDPVAAESFNLVNHIYNPFIICEFLTAVIS